VGVECLHARADTGDIEVHQKGVSGADVELVQIRFTQRQIPCQAQIGNVLQVKPDDVGFDPVQSHGIIRRQDFVDPAGFRRCRTVAFHG